MNARISNLHKTETEWLKLKDFVPEAGEIIIYDPDAYYDYARVKIGDGKRTLNELTFFVDSATLALIKKQRYFDIIDAGRVSDYL